MTIPTTFFLSVILITASFSLSLTSAAVNPPPSSAMAAECSDEIQKLMSCLGFATGKEAAPKKDCCANAEDVKDNEPKCLCVIIQQTSSGSESIRSMGIQPEKLLQLPSACNLKNASVSFCPMILGLSPSSPEARVFLNSTSSTTPTSPSRPATSSEKSSSSRSISQQFNIGIATMMVVGLAVFVSAIPL